MKNVTISNANTAKQGINNPNNLPTGVEQKFAFGNDNAGTGLGKNTWTDPEGVETSLNMTNVGNRVEPVYGVANSLAQVFEEQHLIWLKVSMKMKH